MARPRITVPSFLNFDSRSGKTPDRANAHRETGGDAAAFKRNHVMFTTQSLDAIDHVLSRHSYGIEYAKLFSGMYDQRRGELPDFVEICERHGVVPYIGGGATERAQQQRRLPSFVAEVQRAGIRTIEISNTNGSNGAAQCAKDIAALRRDFERVLVEIGSKDDSQYRSLDLWQRDLDIALQNNADAVILEGAGSGRTGIYDNDGKPNSFLVTALAQRAGSMQDKLLVEAPLLQQREYWMQELFGWNVRLGNIPPNKQHLEATDALRLQAMHPDTKTHILEHRLTHQNMLAALRDICVEIDLSPDVGMFSAGLYGVNAVNQEHHDPHYEELRKYLLKLKTPVRSAPSAPRGRPHIVINVVGGDIRDLLRHLFGDRNWED